MSLFSRLSFLLAVLPAQPLLAQIDGTGLLSQMPEDVQRIRRMQVDWANGGALLTFYDEGKRSSTTLGGIPRALRTKVISNEQDVIDIFDWLYPYFGFQRSEELWFESKRQAMADSTNYVFREYINNIPTPHTLTVEVDNGLGIIVDFRGGLVLDRGFATTPDMSASEAIECGLNYVQQLRRETRAPLGEEHKANVVYRWGDDLVLYPSWEISLAYDNGPAQQPSSSDHFLINHQNKIVTTMMTTHVPSPVPVDCAE